MNTDHLTRQMDLVPLEILDKKITIVGAGAIGGWTTLALAKMGFCNLTVFDYDTVDVVNLSSQLFRLKDIGKKKVQALKDIVFDFTGQEINAIDAIFENGKANGIVIMAVDSMAARRNIFECHLQWPMTTLIDPRMGAEQALLYVVRMGEEKDALTYAKTLYQDSEAVQERCTAKATIYTANMLSGLVCKAVKDELTSKTPLKSAEWNIAENQFLGFNRKQVHDSPAPEIR